MPRYLAELYLARRHVHEISAATARARAAAAELDENVRCLRSIFVPQDETWFLLYEAPDAEAVARAVEHAGLPCPRVLDAV